MCFRLLTLTQIFRALDSVPLSTFRTLGAGLVLQAACELIAASVSQRALAESGAKPAWETIVNLALARQEENVHEAVAGAMAAVSSLQDCTDRIDR